MAQREHLFWSQLCVRKSTNVHSQHRHAKRRIIGDVKPHAQAPNLTPAHLRIVVASPSTRRRAFAPRPPSSSTYRAEDGTPSIAILLLRVPIVRELERAVVELFSTSFHPRTTCRRSFSNLNRRTRYLSFRPSSLRLRPRARRRRTFPTERIRPGSRRRPLLTPSRVSAPPASLRSRRRARRRAQRRLRLRLQRRPPLPLAPSRLLRERLRPFRRLCRRLRALLSGLFASCRARDCESC